MDNFFKTIAAIIIILIALVFLYNHLLNRQVIPFSSSIVREFDPNFFFRVTVDGSEKGHYDFFKEMTNLAKKVQIVDIHISLALCLFSDSSEI